MTTPSASPDFRSRLWLKIACEMTGVGVYPGAARVPALASIMISCSLPANTSIALASAGSDSACVSMPINSGPVIPCAWRYSQMACEMANMWLSLKLPLKEEPRWPDVPNATRCVGSDGSGSTV